MEITPEQEEELKQYIQDCYKIFTDWLPLVKKCRLKIDEEHNNVLE